MLNLPFKHNKKGQKVATWLHYIEFINTVWLSVHIKFPITHTPWDTFKISDVLTHYHAQARPIRCVLLLQDALIFKLIVNVLDWWIRLIWWVTVIPSHKNKTTLGNSIPHLPQQSITKYKALKIKRLSDKNVSLIAFSISKLCNYSTKTVLLNWFLYKVPFWMNYMIWKTINLEETTSCNINWWFTVLIK